MKKWRKKRNWNSCWSEKGKRICWNQVKVFLQSTYCHWSRISCSRKKWTLFYEQRNPPSTGNMQPVIIPDLSLNRYATALLTSRGCANLPSCKSTKWIVTKHLFLFFKKKKDYWNRIKHWFGFCRIRPSHLTHIC